MGQWKRVNRSHRCIDNFLKYDEHKVSDLLLGTDESQGL